MTRLECHCLHGMLQDPSAWGPLEGPLVARSSLSGVTARVIAETIDPPVAGGLVAWARGFCTRVRAEADGRAPGSEGSGGPAPARVLVGYSLGGRLALHAALADPGLWLGIVAVAAHPGSVEAAERARLLERDVTWADRCRTWDPDRLLFEWDQLPVFGGRPNPAPRRATGQDREKSARMFEVFSRGGQEDLRPALVRAVALPPILYLTGELDTAYRAIGDELAREVTGCQHVTIAGAGHRVPWERPDAFVEAVAGFLAGIA